MSEPTVSAPLSIPHPWIDSSQAPLYVLVFPENSTEKELSHCCDVRENWVRQVRSPVAWVVDLSAIQRVTPAKHRIFADHLARIEPYTSKYSAGCGLVVPSPLMRGVVTAIFWFAPPRFPHRLFAGRAEALDWGLRMLSQRRSIQASSGQAAPLPTDHFLAESHGQRELS